MRPDRLVVVVPARDEEAVLGDCLAALDRARSRCPVPVDVVVVADRCRDRTAQVARRAGARVLVSTAGSVGAARSAGVGAALEGVAPAAAQQVWIASTDADSRVPVDWLRHHVDVATAGADLLLGTVQLDDPGAAHTTWLARYAAGTWGSGHLHVHGANLGVRASAYLAAGGFPALAAHEDRVLADRVRAVAGARVVTSTRFPVLTSARLVGRTPEGVAHDLSA